MEEVKVADRAQEVMKKLSADGPKNMLSTSQIRKFLTAVNKITEEVNVDCIENPDDTKLQESLQAEIKFLKVKLAYQIARSKSKWGNPVEDFAKEAKLMEEIDAIKDSIKAYRTFARYIEALVAFHKYYGGRD